MFGAFLCSTVTVRACVTGTLCRAEASSELWVVYALSCVVMLGFAIDKGTHHILGSFCFFYEGGPGTIKVQSAMTHNGALVVVW